MKWVVRDACFAEVPQNSIAPELALPIKHMASPSLSPSLSKSPRAPRAATPGPHSPSRLVVAPALRPTHSLSNLHVHMSGLSPGGTTSHTGEESSASSVINVDMSEGILVPEADAEVGLVDEAGNAYVTASTPIGDEASKKALRDHLRRTLNKKESYTGASRPWL